MPERLSKIFIDSLRLMLRPIVRFAIRRAIKLQEFTESAKVVFLEIAAEELRRSGDTPSASKLSVMTGVHRRDVSRIHADGETYTQTPHVVGKIVGQWQSDRRYLTKDKRPLVLSYEGTESDFSKLVKSVSSDLNPYTVLFELERTGSVKRTERGLQLCASMFVSKGNLREGLAMLAADAEDLYEAVQENINTDNSTRNLHIKTEYDNIILEKLPEIRSWLIKRGSEFQRDVREFLAQFDKDINSSLATKTGGGRVSVGCFSLCESTAATADSDIEKN